MQAKISLLRLLKESLSPFLIKIRETDGYSYQNRGKVALLASYLALNLEK